MDFIPLFTPLAELSDWPVSISRLDPLMRHILTVMSDMNCLQRWASPFSCWQRCGESWMMRGRVSTLTRCPGSPGLASRSVVTSILVTVGLAIWEGRSARALASTLLQADAARIRSDTLVSGAVLAGLVGVRLGFPVVDPLASVLVAAIIAWTASRIVRGASRVLADAAVGDIEEIAKVACSVAGVNGCHQVRSRGIGGMVRVDLHITVDPDMTVAQSHRLAEEVERRIRDQVGGVTEVLIHVGAATLHR